MKDSEISAIIWNILLVICAILMLLPIFWMLVTSFKPAEEVYLSPLQILPNKWQPFNYIDLFLQPGVPLVRWFWNSVFLAIVTTVLVVFISALTAFAFARLQFPFRDRLFFIIVAAMVVPGQVTLVPVYIILQKLRWIDTYYALIIPSLASPFGVFLLRQFFRDIPRDLEDAARIDGCPIPGIYWHIILPLGKAALITLGLLVFMGEWGSFLWPLVVMNSPEKQVIQVGIAGFTTTYGIYWGRIMAASATASVPIILLFVVLQKYYVRGIAMSGIKG